MLRFDIRGIDGVVKAIENKNKAVTTELNMELAASADQIERDAKAAAPVNFGQLRHSIKASASNLQSEVLVGALYGPYVEFGTGGKVDTQGFPEVAAQFRGGKGGTFEQMVDDLTEWVNKKGISGTYSIKSRRRQGSALRKAIEDRQLARFLAMKILRSGIRPQPYLIPAFLREKPKLINRIKKLL